MWFGKGVIGAAAVSTALLFGQGAQAAYYFNDFETLSTPNFSAFGSVQGTQGYSNISGFTGFGSEFLRNDTSGAPGAATVLTLTGLPTHTGIKLGFLLAIIDSWDASGCCSPDSLNVQVNGVTVFNETFDNFNNGAGQSFAGTPIGGSRTQLGFNGGFNDAAYDLTALASLQNIAHTSSVLAIEWRTNFTTTNSFQGGLDESFAIDKVSVDLLGVATAAAPEPASLALIGASLLGFGAIRRRFSRR